MRGGSDDLRMKNKIIALGILLVLLASAAVGTASALSNLGGGEWIYYREMTVKEEKAW
ncbi:MAG: hypothetical protein ACXQTL_02620 [Methanosarcinales archaeon]